MITVILYIRSKSSHISSILTGMIMLQKNKIVDLELYDLTTDSNHFSYNQPGVELLINDKKCFVDVSDGYNNIDFMRKNINNYYIYFKRSYDEKINNQHNFNNILPLGLNYEVYDKKIKYKYYDQKKINKYLLKIIEKAPFIYTSIKDYEYNGLCNVNNPKICFTTRLWDGEENQELNNSRINLVRCLKAKYKNKFCGGIYDSKLARKLCPELIVNKLYTQKKIYLRRMHKCDICIATSGLHKSIGWKFAEYVMAGKVIVSEKLNYYVPGDFKKNSNYIEFSSTEECVEIIDELIKNKEKMIEISKNNINYYNTFLRPDKMMLYIIKKVMGKDFD